MHDITVPLDAGTPEWPGDTPFSCGWTAEIARGGSVNLSTLQLSPHVGTHADAPLHVTRGGAGADQLPLATFLGAARVVDVSRVEGAITLADLQHAGYTDDTIRLLLHTGRTVATGSFPSAWPSLDPDAARALARAGLKLLGVDCPSVDDRESKSLAVHHALFDGGAHVLENLDLRGIAPGEWDLLALPMAMGAVDAAPVRALLRPRSSGAALT
jgi:arylformamidase